MKVIEFPLETTKKKGYVLTWPQEGKFILFIDKILKNDGILSGKMKCIVKRKKSIWKVIEAIEAILIVDFLIKHKKKNNRVKFREWTSSHTSESNIASESVVHN